MPCFEQVAFGSGIDSYNLSKVIAYAGIQSEVAAEACLCSYEEFEFLRQFQRCPDSLLILYFSMIAMEVW